MKISQVLKISLLLILFVGQEIGAFQGLTQYLFSIKSTVFRYVRSKIQKTIDLEEQIENIKKDIEKLDHSEVVAVQEAEQNLPEGEEGQQNVVLQESFPLNLAALIGALNNILPPASAA